MEKETKHTPERWEAKLIFRTNLDKVGVWVVTDITDGTRLFMKLNTPRAEHHAKLIASAPTLKAENERLAKALKSSDDALTQNATLRTELSEMKKEREELIQAVEKLHIGLVARGNYDGSVTCKMVEELKTKYKF